ncbi:hypothetical protein AWQ21_13290 [Picosynechococcus sp. PCC 7003]|uniref:hypothetical protein n=1 Tax=Picosynechococcus sp. PCC 7003 TaxID=374981 RepID=UPI00081037F0|nr:hypothetical protein [Picosynechococcus sp. PCC 7003]ANV85260.1 hypothetical protein AWQ21_13290 [Picosynechococcus sp. PCC 7003]
MFDSYLSELITAVKQGNATEHTHRATLQKLLQSLDNGLTVTNEPKRIDCGAPDLLIQKDYQEIGHLEAKDVGKSLKREEKSQQMKRYLAALGNLILTDYLDFRWYVDGRLQAEGRLGKLNTKGEFKADEEGQKQVETILKGFLVARVTQAKNPRDLAKRMANLAQLIREAIATKLKNAKSGVLFDQYKSFQQVLMRDLSTKSLKNMAASLSNKYKNL